MDGIKMIITPPGDLATFLWLFLRPQGTLAAENLFLRKPDCKPMRLITCITVSILLALSPVAHSESATPEQDYLRARYEQLHANPELSFQEQATSARIAMNSVISAFA